MTILFLYQDIESGAKIATESLIAAYADRYPKDRLIVYKQIAHRYRGVCAFLKNVLWSIWDIRRVINKQQHIDVIISPLYTFAAAWRLSDKRGIPAIFQVHGDQRLPEHGSGTARIAAWYHDAVRNTVSALQLFALRSSSLLTFVSQHARVEFLTANRCPDCFDKSVILPNGVDTTIFTTSPASQQTVLRAAYGAGKGIHIGYIGRIDVKKGIHHIIRALPLIGRTVTLWIGYPPPTDHYSANYLTRLRSLAEQLPPGSRVRFIERPTPISNLYGILDYLVLPSEQEMLPLVLLEALSCGVLPIATDVGGTKEILSRVDDRLIIPRQTASAISLTLRQLIRLPAATKQKLRNRGRQLIDGYSWDAGAKILHRELTTIQP